MPSSWQTSGALLSPSKARRDASPPQTQRRHGRHRSRGRASEFRKAGRYAHARQFKRMKSAIKRQRTIVGRLQREIERKASAIGAAVQAAQDDTLNKAKRIWAQSAGRKAVDGRRKLYAWHAPEVDCISKGKARTPYEFGVKVGIARTLKGNLIVGAKSFHGNPHDGHTLHEQLEQATILMQDSAAKPAAAFVDLGYRGVDAQNPDVRIVHRGKSKRISQQERQLLKRR
jgi:IS5 family transposase